MAAAQFDIIIEVGVKYERFLVWQGSDGQPIDLSNWTALMQVRQDVKSEIVLAELSTQNNKISLNWDGAFGKIRLFIPTAETKAFTSWTDAVYDLVLFDPSSEGYRLLKGRVRLDPSVTRTAP